jgi:hypothetical protein
MFPPNASAANAPANRRGEQEKVYLKDKSSNYHQTEIHARLAASG